MDMESNQLPSSSKADNVAFVSPCGTCGDDDAEEAQYEEPPLNELDDDTSQELEDFRRRWRDEIEVSPVRDAESTNRNNKSVGGSSQHRVHVDVPQKIEDQARSLFLCGVQAERAGLLEKAISYYRRAVQLVPDIEFRVADYTNDHSNSYSDDDSDGSSDKENMPYDDLDPDITNLMEKFQKIAFHLHSTCICQPKVEQKGTHMSTLPPEVFNYILKWIVSSDLDMRSLEQTSKVCRGFYICARDPEIWRLACLRIWGANAGSPNRYGGWRNMFVQRPHLFFNGAYISKTTYIRYGEPSFQDTNYRPCYLVEYYRYLRFFPEGLVLMLTTPEDPIQSLCKLRYRRTKYQSVMYGRYKLIGSTIVAIIKKPKSDSINNNGLNYYKYRRQRQVNIMDGCDQTFHIELDLKSIKNRYHCQLVWKHYSFHVVYRNGQETVSDFDLTPSKYPPFWFSRVKSYTAESECPLK